MMLCPCCGNDIADTRQCSCGARFVGEPLGGLSVRVQRLGPVMIAIVLFVAVVGSSLIITKWLAFAGGLAIWQAWRAVRLARRDPIGYGGYRAAAATLIISLAAGAVAVGYGIAYIPRFLDNRRERQISATTANMYHILGILQEYRQKHGGLPPDLQALNKLSDQSLPSDYWDKRFKYQSWALAAETPLTGGAGRINIDRRGARSQAEEQTPLSGINFNNFELRSAGPDEKLGTDDDIIMRDGLVISAAEAAKQPIPSSTASR
jgi:hypothetical protein